MLCNLVQKKFNGHLHTLRESTGERGTDAAMGTPGPLKHLHGGHVGLSHPLLWAAGCLAALCVMTGSGHHPGPDVTTARLY